MSASDALYDTVVLLSDFSEPDTHTIHTYYIKV